jgi:hypothetical protein
MGMRGVMRRGRAGVLGRSGRLLVAADTAGVAGTAAGPPPGLQPYYLRDELNYACVRSAFKDRTSDQFYHAGDLRLFSIIKEAAKITASIMRNEGRPQPSRPPC